MTQYQGLFNLVMLLTQLMRMELRLQQSLSPVLMEVMAQLVLQLTSQMEQPQQEVTTITPQLQSTSLMGKQRKPSIFPSLMTVF